MNETYFRLEGKDALISQLRQVGADVETGVSEALKLVGDKTKKEIQAMLQEGNGFPSAPEEPPHSESGNLRSKIFDKLDQKILGTEILLTVGITMKGFYGFILEYGAAKYAKGFKRKHSAGEGLKNQATNGVRLLPRPFFWPAVENFWANTPVKVEEAVRKALVKYAR